MSAKLRIARPTNDLALISEMYLRGLNLKILGSFKDHAGFDGIMLGDPARDYHFEFTLEHGVKAPPPSSRDSLVVLYLPDKAEWERKKAQLLSAGFKPVKSHNPYWDQHGCTFEDADHYRVVLCQLAWPDLP